MADFSVDISKNRTYNRHQFRKSKINKQKTPASGVFFMMLSAACEYQTMHPALYKSEQSERETALLNANTTRGKLHGSSLVMEIKPET